MKVFVVLSGIALIGACDAQSVAMPPFEDIQTAVVEHARCIDGSVDDLSLFTGSREDQLEIVRGDCARERQRALRFNAVPVFEDTVEEYDAMQDGLAASLIETRNEGQAQ